MPRPQDFPHSAKHNKCIMFTSLLPVIILAAVSVTALRSHLPPRAPMEKRQRHSGRLHVPNAFGTSSLVIRFIMRFANPSINSGRNAHASAYHPPALCVRRLPSLHYGRLPPRPVRPQGLPGEKDSSVKKEVFELFILVALESMFLA